MQMLTSVYLGYGSPHGSQDPGATNLNFLRNIANPMQKKVTRGEFLVSMLDAQSNTVQMANQPRDEARSLIASPHKLGGRNSIVKHNG